MSKKTFSISRHSAYNTDRKTVRLNIGGQRFEVFRSTIYRKPRTRLHWVLSGHERGISHEDIEYRDGELYFDRDPMAFHFILQYYRTGHLHSPLSMCGPAFQDELIYWQIEDDAMEACCWPTYESQMQAADTFTAMSKLIVRKQTKTSSFRHASFTIPKVERFRGLLRRGLQTKSSYLSKVYVALSTVFTITSVLNVALISVPQLRTMDGVASPYIFKPSELTVRELILSTEPHYALLTIDFICNFYFCLEFILLVSTTKKFRTFFTNFLNLTDLACNIMVIGEYCYVLVWHQRRLDWDVVFYISRVIRIVRLIRHITGLEVIIFTFKASLDVLTLLMALFSICVVLLGSTLYICEQFEETPANKFVNIPISFYWAVISLTTIGYGDYSPTSPAGLLIGTVTALMAILVIVLPVPIIANNFCLFYSHAQARLRTSTDNDSIILKPSMHPKKGRQKMGI